MGEIPREQEETSEGGETYPEYLQEMVKQLEFLEKQPLPDWHKKDKKLMEGSEKRISDLRAEVEAQKEILGERAKKEQIQRGHITELLGEQAIDEIAHMQDSLNKSIGNHLFSAEKQEQARKIMDLWKEFIRRIGTELDGSDQRPEKIEELLKKWISSIYR